MSVHGPWAVRGTEFRSSAPDGHSKFNIPHSKSLLVVTALAGLAAVVAAVVVAVSIAVAVSVAVTVAVAVAALFVARAVQDERHVAVFLLVVQAIQLRKHRPLEQPGADYEERAVHEPVDDLGVGHNLDRRTVHNHIVIKVTGILDQFAEPG